MSHNLFLVFPLPVTLAFATMVILLLLLARMVALLCKPVPVRLPAPRNTPPGPGTDTGRPADAGPQRG
jgi:hypothetical protein